MALTFSGPEPGRWIAEALTAQRQAGLAEGAVAEQVPAGYPAYARVFHPATDEDGNPVRWADVARACGTVFHVEAQFAAVSGIGEGGLPWREDAWPGEAPNGEGLPARDLAAVAAAIAAQGTTAGAASRNAAVTAAHGTTAGADGDGAHPDAAHGGAEPHGDAAHAGAPVYLALWDGYAFIRGGDAMEVLMSGDEADPDPALAARERELRAELKRPAFAPEVLEGAKLQIGPSGYRSYYVFAGTLEDLAHPLWKSGTSFSERQAPNLAWAGDHSWVMSTELYEDSTIIAGSAELVRALAEDPRLEVRVVDLAANLGVHGDRINPAPELPGY